MIDGRQQAKLVQRLGERRGDEKHVIAFAAAGRHLAHDFFVGGVHGDLEIDAGGGLEFLRHVLGHVAIPVGDDEFFRLGHGNAGHERKRAASYKCRNMLEFHDISLPACLFT